MGLVAPPRGGEGREYVRVSATDDCVEVDASASDVEARRCVGPEGVVFEEVDEDGDERREEFDANGTLRLSWTEDGDGDEVLRVFDEHGTLLDVRRDDDDDD